MLNRWNVSCGCPKAGYVWNSLYGMCIDVDECSNIVENKCDTKLEACINLPGTYRCACKWGHILQQQHEMINRTSQMMVKCNASPALAVIKLQTHSYNTQDDDETNNNLKAKSILHRIRGIFDKNCAVLCYIDVKLLFLVIVLVSKIKLLNCSI